MNGLDEAIAVADAWQATALKLVEELRWLRRVTHVANHGLSQATQVPVEECPHKTCEHVTRILRSFDDARDS